MSILNNAIQAIECGIEDYRVGTDARFKSSIRNVYAGVLLLLKEKLSQLSNPKTENALLKQNVVPVKVNGKIIWKGDGKKTVDVFDLEQRFKGLGIKFDWKKLKDIGAIRNDVEHYFPTASQLAIQEALAKLFALMRNFMMRELKIDPRKKFSNELWETLIGIDQVYEEEWAACQLTHKYFESESKNLNSHVAEFVCPDCGSSLVRFKPRGIAECRACGESFDKERTILALVETVHGADDYVAVKDGADPVIATCPECDEEAYIMDENRCAVCGEAQESTCQRCHCAIPASEIGGEYCSYCQHQMDKDD